MTECGQMIRLVVKALIAIVMEQNTSVDGRIMFSMEKVLRHGLMVLNIKETTLMVKNLAKAVFHGQMAAYLKVIL